MGEYGFKVFGSEFPAFFGIDRSNHLGHDKTERHLRVIALQGTYFAGFGLGFLVRPAFVTQFGLSWDAAAGKTEVRCYYGAVSIAISAFLLYLVHEDLAREALTEVLFLASAVLVVRILGTIVDGGWSHPYTRSALPIETAFVVALAIVRFR